MKKEKFVPSNNVKKRKINWWMASSIVLLVMAIISSLQWIKSDMRIGRAIELLSGDNDEVVKPAKLYAILTGQTFVPYKAKDLASDDQKKDTQTKLDALPNSGVPVR